jgi:hypothetical protein
MPFYVTKDPSAVLDYGVDWTDWLDGDTISTSTWTVPSGITKDSDSKTTTGTIIWLSGGTLGESYVLVNRIVTTNSPARTDERTIVVRIEQK